MTARAGEFGSGLPRDLPCRDQASGFRHALIGRGCGRRGHRRQRDRRPVRPRLERAAVVTGRVDRRHRSARVGLRVRLSSASTISRLWLPGSTGAQTTAHTESIPFPRGRLRVPGRAVPGHGRVVPDKARSRLRRHTHPGGGWDHPTVDFSISTGHRISGTVTTRFSGEPVAVSVPSTCLRRQFLHAGWTTADSTGAFQFSGFAGWRLRPLRHARRAEQPVLRRRGNAR